MLPTVLEDLVDHPLALALGLLPALLLIAGLWWWRSRRRRDRSTAAAAAAAVRPTPPPPAARSPLPALSLDSFAPLHPPQAMRPAQRPARPAAPDEPVPVLVVDDSAVARTLLRRLLQGAGYRVDVASDGDEALVLLNSQRYAVLITDLEMPRLDGMTLIAELQARPASRDLPIIAITAHEALSARVHEMKGLYGIFHKPWNDAELLARVASLARLRKLADGG